MNIGPPGRIFAAVAAIAGWISLGIQFILLLESRVTPVPEAILRYFTYFTILTNILAALTYTSVWLYPNPGWMKRLAVPSWTSAVTVYMLVVGIVYNTVLRSLRELHGIDYFVDEFLHVILPLSVLIFWVLFVRKSPLKWKMALTWLAYPFGYILFVMLVGSFTGFYPYPFADARKLGYPKALANGFWIIIGFLVLSLVLIGIGKRKRAR